MEVNGKKGRDVLSTGKGFFQALINCTVISSLSGEHA